MDLLSVSASNLSPKCKCFPLMPVVNRREGEIRGCTQTRHHQLIMWICELTQIWYHLFLFSERRKCNSETDNRGTTTPRTKIYIYTLSCQWDPCERSLWEEGIVKWVFILHIGYFNPTHQLSSALLEQQDFFFTSVQLRVFFKMSYQF